MSFIPRSVHYDHSVNSSAGFFHLPPTVLDAFIPGYSLLARSLSEFGIDISLFVSCFALGIGVWTALRFALPPIWTFLLDTFSSSVTVEEYDPIYDHVLIWASSQKSLDNIRELRVRSAGQYNDEDDGDYEIRMDEDLSADTIFNFNDWSARAPPKFEPHQSSGYFLHHGRWYKFDRNKEHVAGDYSGTVYDREWLEITVLWPSTKPIKNLIEEAREFHLARQTSTTVIRRPETKSQRGRRNAWTTVAVRPSRSMATVVLDDEQKAAILKDINEFLHPKTARWYSNRGIPYRRGYLFHGPPGTGKTSLSFALAGVFGLDIYCLSLSEATLTEEDLIILFNSLPKRCILLLEDIDSARIVKARRRRKKKTRREDVPKRTEDETKKQGGDSANARSDDVGPSIARKGDRNRPKDTNTLSISGLLNAIDGVASQEGRVLVMTTNYPEKLDAALIRPGRVDLKIEFRPANRKQIKELFLRMYCVDTMEAVRQPTKISQILPGVAMKLIEEGDRTGGTADRKKEKNAVADGQNTHRGAQANELHLPEMIALSVDDLQKEELAKDPAAFRDYIEMMAEPFANALPELTFSPAEIQGFLLMRKSSPTQALIDVSGWRDNELKGKLCRGSELDEPGVGPQEDAQGSSQGGNDSESESGQGSSTDSESSSSDDS